MKDDDPRTMTPAQLRDAILAAHGDRQSTLIRAAVERRDFPLSWLPRRLLASRLLSDYSRNGSQG